LHARIVQGFSYGLYSNSPSVYLSNHIHIYVYIHMHISFFLNYLRTSWRCCVPLKANGRLGMVASAIPAIQEANIREDQGLRPALAKS
jgi:hypothetical protein